MEKLEDIKKHSEVSLLLLKISTSIDIFSPSPKAFLSQFSRWFPRAGLAQVVLERQANLTMSGHELGLGSQELCEGGVSNNCVLWAGICGWSV